MQLVDVIVDLALAKWVPCVTHIHDLRNLKFQLDLDTFHHLIVPRILVDVDYDDVGSQCVCHVSYSVTSELRPLGELTFSTPFSVEVVSAKVDHHWIHLTSSNGDYALPRSDGPHSLRDFG
jgi:hypothetical protein